MSHKDELSMAVLNACLMAIRVHNTDADAAVRRINQAEDSLRKAKAAFDEANEARTDMVDFLQKRGYRVMFDKDESIRIVASGTEVAKYDPQSVERIIPG